VPPRVLASSKALLVPQRALILSVAWALEASVLIEIASHEASLDLKVVNLVPLRALTLLEGLALDSVVISPEVGDLA